MTWKQFKEANRLLWIDKGHLIPLHWTDEEIESMADRCFGRLWGNNEKGESEVGFEEAFKKKYKKIPKRFITS
tara:strand:- start:2177 stop:2395 length:219 start_codon:yes stop_codon:yes gene_type:complete